MSQANELLKSVAGNSRLVNPDIEAHIVVGEDRYITVPDELKRIAVQYDHDIETVTFDCPRYWDGHDLSKMQIYINYARPDKTLGSYLAQNVTVDAEDDTIIHFTWTVSSHVTEIKGKISFLVCAKGMEDVFVGEKVDTPAGIIWQDVVWFRGVGVTDNLKHVCYGKTSYGFDRYVAVGENGATHYWNNYTWFHGGLAGDKTLYSVTYGNNKFVAVGDSDHVYYSEDGEKWSISNSAVMPDTLRDVVYGNGVYVAVGCDGIIYTSRDGIDWSTVVGEISKTLDLLSVVYGNGKFMAVDSGGGVYISTDGIDWSSGNPINNGSTYYYIKDVVYGNNKFVAVGGYNDGCVFYSEDGEQWIRGNITSNHQLKSIAYGNTRGVDMFVAVDNEVGEVYHSTDGVNWTKSVEQSIGLYGITYGPNTFITVGDNGSIYSSHTTIVPVYEPQLTNHWNTELNDSIYISEGLETEETIIESNPDIFAQLIELMNSTEDKTSQNAENARNSADIAVASAAEAKGYLDSLGDEADRAAASAEAAAEVAEQAAKSAADAQSTVDTLNQALEHVEELAEEANTSATTATTKAEEAATSATNAKASEDNAAASATAAATSAEQARNHYDNTVYMKSQTLSYCEAADRFKQSAEAAAEAAATSETNTKTSETNSKASETAAKTSETNASKSATDAATSAEAAAESEQNAKTSDTNAKTSETNAATSAEAAAASASKALVSEENAARLAHNADTYRSQAFTAADSARGSATNAATSETNAKTSETNAATSEANAKDSETAAKTSETNASKSATNASVSATTATTKAEEAATSAANAKASEEMAKQHEKNTMTYKSQALTYCEQADSFKRSAETAATNAATSASNASTSATNASDSADAAYEEAERARQFADQAQTNANNASTSASNASTSATNAARSASEAAQSATDAANLLEEVFQSVSDGKSLVASAITDKGVDTASDATFETMATNIGKIETGGSSTSPFKNVEFTTWYKHVVATKNTTYAAPVLTDIIATIDNTDGSLSSLSVDFIGKSYFKSKVFNNLIATGSATLYKYYATVKAVGYYYDDTGAETSTTLMSATYSSDKTMDISTYHRVELIGGRKQINVPDETGTTIEGEAYTTFTLSLS